MLTDDTLTNAQPEARPRSDLLGGEERLEDPPQYLWRDAGAVVTHTDLHHPLGCAAAHRHDAGPAGRCDRLLRVAQDIQHDLHEPLLIAPDRGQALRNLDVHLDCAPPHVVRLQGAGPLDHRPQVDRLAVRVGAPREGEQVRHDSRGPLALGIDRLGVAPRLGGEVLLHQQLGEAKHAIEGVVDLVGHAGGQLADRCEVPRALEALRLGLVEHPLRFFALGDVLDHAEDALHRACLAGNGSDGDIHRNDSTAAVRELLLEAQHVDLATGKAPEGIDAPRYGAADPEIT